METSLTTKLQMVFSAGVDKIHSVTINQPREGLTSTEVKALMENILSNDALEGNNGKITGIKSAALITRSVEPFEVL
jgi:hypothetical protein